MKTTVGEVISVAIAIVGLAALSVMIVNGDKTATVFKAGFDGFGGLISKATNPGS